MLAMKLDDVYMLDADHPGKLCTRFVAHVAVQSPEARRAKEGPCPAMAEQAGE
jgi:hypothetical protein